MKQINFYIINFFISFEVVAANPMMRSTTNILIINLAVADLLFVIFCECQMASHAPQCVSNVEFFAGVPFTATDYILNSWPFGDFMCRFVSEILNQSLKLL